jgi:hypothetical protein
MLIVFILCGVVLALGIIFYKDIMVHRKKKELARTMSQEGAKKNKERIEQI